MTKTNASTRWGALCAIVAGIAFLAPLALYFYLILIAGSSATHAQDPASFLPWMTAHGTARVALWWAVGVTFLIALLGVPRAVKKDLKPSHPIAAPVAELAGTLGLFTLLLASLMLAAGEMPLAQAYVAAGESARPAIVAVYEWQRLVTALLFDVLGFFLLGVWVLVSSVAGLRSRRWPRGIGWFGVVAALTAFCYVTGYITGITWLGETGIGVLAFFSVPAWMLLVGIALWRTGQPATG